MTGQLVSQLLYKSSSLIEDREPKHLEEMIELFNEEIEDLDKTFTQLKQRE